MAEDFRPAVPIYRCDAIYNYFCRDYEAGRSDVDMFVVRIYRYS